MLEKNYLSIYFFKAKKEKKVKKFLLLTAMLCFNGTQLAMKQGLENIAKKTKQDFQDEQRRLARLQREEKEAENLKMAIEASIQEERSRLARLQREAKEAKELQMAIDASIKDEELRKLDELEKGQG